MSKTQENIISKVHLSRQIVWVLAPQMGHGDTGGVAAGQHAHLHTDLTARARARTPWNLGGEAPDKSREDTV